MKKLLVLCPSKSRPFKLLDMIKTFNATVDKNNTDLMVLLDDDDTELRIYLEKLPKWVKVNVYNREGDITKTTEILNRAWEEQKDNYEFFSVTNDDFKYRTTFWDLRLCNKNRISTGFEPNMFNKHGYKTLSFPVTSVIDGEIIKAVGWIQYPLLIHSGGDNVWNWIGRRLKISYFDQEVVYEHENPFIGEWEEDNTFSGINNKDILGKDYKTYMNWLKYEINNDLNKIKERALCHSITQ